MICLLIENFESHLHKALAVVQVGAIWIELEKHNEHAVPTLALYKWASPCQDVKLIQVLFGMGTSKTKLYLLFRYLYWLICYISKTRALKDG